MRIGLQKHGEFWLMYNKEAEARDGQNWLVYHPIYNIAARWQSTGVWQLVGWPRKILIIRLKAK